MALSPSEIWRFKLTIATTLAFSTNHSITTSDVTIESISDTGDSYLLKGTYNFVLNPYFSTKSRGLYEAKINKEGKIVSLVVDNKRIVST